MSTVPNGVRLSAEALAAKRQYQAEWREKNRERLRDYNRQYAAAHPTDPERRAAYNRSYWEKRAATLRGESDNELQGS